MRLSQCICDNDLRVKPNTLSCKFFHLFVKEEKNVYMRCITQKKKKNYTAFGKQLVISHSTRLRL